MAGGTQTEKEAVLKYVRAAFEHERRINLHRYPIQMETVRESLWKHHGVSEVSIKDDVVLLDDHVTNFAQKRLAGVLAWWVPGVRDVINGMEVTPPEEDNDDEVTDAVRLVLEKDCFLNAGQIRVITRTSVVTLEGLVRTEVQKNMAENDAWYVFEVDKVINNLVIQG